MEATDDCAFVVGKLWKMFDPGEKNGPRVPTRMPRGVVKWDMMPEIKDGSPRSRLRRAWRREESVPPGRGEPREGVLELVGVQGRGERVMEERATRIDAWSAAK